MLFCERTPSTATNSEIATCMNKTILANRSLTIDEISDELSVSLESLYKIANPLKFHKVCS